MITDFKDEFGDLRKIFPRDIEVRSMLVGRIGKAFIAADVAITGWDVWSETQGEPVWYRIGYTTAETGIKVGAAAGGMALGVKVVGPLCPFFCAVAGGVGGALVASVAADHTSDFIIERIG